MTTDDLETQGTEEQRQTMADKKRPAKKKQRDCYWDGRRYSPGGVVKGPDGGIYRCRDGEWDRDVEIGGAVLERQGTEAPSTPEQSP